jgi:nicotinate-nucleotide adenylyltransferase
MSSIALLGGSFNPPHLGHQMICLWALSTGRAPEVWLVPTFAHAFNKELVPFEHRSAMCQHLVQLFAPGKVMVCSIEAELSAPSLTYNTLQSLCRRYPQHQFHLMVGADILQEKDAWYRFDEIERLAPLLVIGRAGYPSPDETVILPAISSSQIRARLARGQDVSGLLPASVLAYIQAHHLYHCRGT